MTLDWNKSTSTWFIPTDLSEEKKKYVDVCRLCFGPISGNSILLHNNYKIHEDCYMRRFRTLKRENGRKKH